MQDKLVTIDRNRAVSEILDGEAVVINMETGVYYSLSGSAAAVWRLLEGPASAATIARALSRSHDADEATIRAAVAELLADIEKEGLLAEATGTPAETAAPAGPKTPWEKPRLERFTDMKDFLLVDPIHEVTEKGWPHAR